MNDREIVALYHARSESAITQTAEIYGGYCHAIAFAILQSDEDAAECVNDTYLRAWNAIPPAAPANLRTYLGKITRNLSFDLYKRRHADKRSDGQIPLVLDELAECLAPAKGTDSLVDQLLIKETLNRFLQSLPTTQRWIFMRRYWYADSIKSIAGALHKSESDVHVTLHRLRKKLKILLEKEGITL